MRDILSCESHVVDESFFVPMYISEIGFMNASFYWGNSAFDYGYSGQQNLEYSTDYGTDKCMPGLLEEEIKEARRWYENLYDVL